MATSAPLVSERLCGDLQQPISALAWSADGAFLAIASAGGELLLLDSAPRTAEPARRGRLQVRGLE